MLKIDIITIFPEAFNSYFNLSILKRAQDRRLIKIKAHNLRNWTADKHQRVDDKPYGGGPGMIFKFPPLYQAIKDLKHAKAKKKIVLLTPQGKIFNQRIAEKFSKLDQLILICGRYEGVDKRVEKFVDEKISIGQYILTGGEIPAMILVETVARLIPGVIKKESLIEETRLSSEGKNVIREYPQYTRPSVFTYRDQKGKIKKLSVPRVLLSGDHQKIKDWRKENW